MTTTRNETEMVKYCQFWKDCHQRAIVRLKYCGITVCKEHYLKNIEARVEKALTHYHMKEPGPNNHWLVPMTGTAASQVLLEILCKIAAKMAETRSPLKLTAAFVDLGISPSAKDLVLAICAQHSVPCITVDLKTECGYNAAEIAAMKGSLPIDDYSAIEALKLQILHKRAVELKVTRIATEITLVDEATALFKKFLGMDVCELAREHSWERTKSLSANLPLKVRPLIEVSDEEVALYTRVCDIKVAENPEIFARPYDPVRKHLLEIELDRTGNMLNIVRRFHKVFMPMIEKVGEEEKEEKGCENDEENPDKLLIKSLLPLNDVVEDEDQVVPCKRCKVMGASDNGGESEVCRACWVLDCVRKGKVDGGDISEIKKRNVVSAVDVDDENVGDEFKYFISTDVRGIRAKRKDRMLKESK